MKQILLETAGGQTELALLDGRTLTDYRAYPGSGVFSEQIYLARVDRVAKGMAAAFVALPDRQTGFLPLDEAMRPLRGGQTVLAQVRKPPVGEKAAYLTEDISLAGRYVLLLPRTAKTAVSSRVTDPKEKERLSALARALAPDGMGLILRKESVHASPEEIRPEIETLAALWRRLSAEAEQKAAPALIWNGRTPLSRALDDWETPDRVTADRPVGDLPGIPCEVSDHPFALYSVREQRRKLTERRVWLPGGGFLVVDPCEALTVIDVNTGKDTGKGTDRESLFLQTNLEAARMITRLLRVRGVGGIVIIDFIDMREDASREQVLSCLRELTLSDPVKCVIHGFTSLGLVEMTRKKSG